MPPLLPPPLLHRNCCPERYVRLFVFLQRFCSPGACSVLLQDFVLDVAALERCIEDLPMRGVKGTTGTQATFLQLFDGDHDKVCGAHPPCISHVG